MELLCPAGCMPSLKAAVDAGADAVYIGFRDGTNARQFPGLNFTYDKAGEGVAYAHRAGASVYVALNTYAQPQRWSQATQAAERAVELGADVLIIADIGLLAWVRERYPGVTLHLSVQGSATNDEALKFYQQEFGIKRAVLPRVLSLTQVKRLAEHSPVELEVFGFGNLCIMAEGRCYMSSYMTGESPNGAGVCSPAWAVRWNTTDAGLDSRLNGMLINRFGPQDYAGYPTLCKGRFKVGASTYHAMEEPVSLNTLALLPALQAAGIAAVKIEGRQRSPAYVAAVTRVWRQALDRLAHEPRDYTVRKEWMATLAGLSEGAQTTLGAYHRPWQ